jgi:hypothetical protein
MSKRYPLGQHAYWYGYSPEQNYFLSNNKRSFFILGCVDRDCVYAVPHERIAMILNQLHFTPKTHWHIALEENQAGGLDISIPNSESKIRLNEFEFKLNK